MKQGILFIAWMVLIGSVPALADDSVYELEIKDHQFAPASLAIPAGQKVRVIVKNQDATPEEFESFDLNREKVVAGHSKITLFLGPLHQGVYKFFGDFHKDSAKGVIEVK